MQAATPAGSFRGTPFISYTPCGKPEAAAVWEAHCAEEWKKNPGRLQPTTTTLEDWFYSWSRKALGIYPVSEDGVT